MVMGDRWKNLISTSKKWLKDELRDAKTPEQQTNAKWQWIEKATSSYIGLQSKTDSSNKEMACLIELTKRRLDCDQLKTAKYFNANAMLKFQFAQCVKRENGGYTKCLLGQTAPEIKGTYDESLVFTVDEYQEKWAELMDASVKYFVDKRKNAANRN